MCNRLIVHERKSVPRFSHIAGDRMLDLVNTVEWRLGGPTREEDLRTFGDVVDWCQESGLTTASEHSDLARLGAADPAGAESQRVRVVALREAAYGALFEADPSAGAVLATEHRRALRRAHLATVDGRWWWVEDQEDLTVPGDRIARGLTALVLRDDLDRLSQCADDRCGWVYLDTSPRRNRRWCVAGDCGDRNRARAYYARSKARSGQTG